MWKTLLNFDPIDNYRKMFSVVCSHRNWKSEFFTDIDKAKVLFSQNLDVFSEQCDKVHLDAKPSCSLCTFSLLFMNLYDPHNDVSDCISCDAKTVYLFCSKCANVLN